MLNDPSLSGDERIEAKAALEKFDRAGLEVFQLILRGGRYRARGTTSATRALCWFA